MLKSRQLVASVTLLGITALIATMGAQVNRGTTEWLTAGADAQRTFWVRSDPRISVASVSQPGFDLQWSANLGSRAQGLSLGQGVSANGVTLFIPMTIVGGTANNVYALDNDTGYVVWQRHFEGAPPRVTAQCPGGTVATTRIVPLVPPATAAPAAAGGGGATQAYRSVLGQPGEGAPVEVRGRGPGPIAGPPAGGAPAAAGAPAAGRGPAPAAAAPARAGGPPIPGGPSIPGATLEQLGGGRGGLGRPSGVAYAVSSDGALHVVGLPSGKDIQRPTEFLPPNARWSDTIAVNTTLYATTTGNCGGAPNAIWATDLESDAKPVVSWKTNGGPMVGRVAFGADGTLFAAVGPGPTTAGGRSNAIVALDPKMLQVKDWFTQTGAEFVTGPMVFKQNDLEFVAAATKDGRVMVLNATALGGADHATPQASGALDAAGGSIAADALASWQDTSGTRWILAATTNGVAAAKLSNAGGRLTLERGWTAQNLAVPATPIVVNGVVFALATGRPALSAGSAGPAGRGAPAVLHAYEGISGKELWTSGKAMTAFASAGSFWSAHSQVYVGTSDGRLNAFGLPDERR